MTIEERIEQTSINAMTMYGEYKIDNVGEHAVEIRKNILNLDLNGHPCILLAGKDIQ